MPTINSSTISDSFKESFSSPFTDKTPVAFYSSIPSLGDKSTQGCLSCALTGLSRARVSELKTAQTINQSGFSSALFDSAPKFGSVTSPETPGLPPIRTGPGEIPAYPETITPVDGDTIIVHRGLVINYYTTFYSCQTSLGLNLLNNTIVGINMIVEGNNAGLFQGVDDDVLFDGIVWENNMHIFSEYAAGSPCWGMAARNGAHGFYLAKRIPPFGKFLIQGRDNAYGGWIRCRIIFP